MKANIYIYIYIYIYILKIGILIPDLYLYDIKIQTDINQNGIEKNPWENIVNWVGPVLAQPQGWTQPNRVGWADVPARNNRAGISPAAWAGLVFQPAEKHVWLLCMSTVTD
jgi:hypothetical protein